MNQGVLIRSLVIALPTGLLLTGLASMMNTHLGPKEEPLDPNLEVRLDAASLNRKDVNRPDLERFVGILSDTIGERHVGKPEKLEQAAFWLESTLGGGNIGYVVDRQTYEVDDVEVRNLIAELPGKTKRSEIVVVGAHYDTVPGCPGANDNGTGVAALVSLAQAFAGNQQERTVRFVAFVNEEPPYFHTDSMGSRVYAKRCRARKENIVAMISLETIGYYSDAEGSQEIPPGLDGQFPTRGNFLAFVGNEASRFIADSARAAFTRASGIPALAGGFPVDVPGVAWSDHWSFWQEGYTGIMVTDTAPYRYAHYHKSTDMADKIDFEKLTSAVQGLEAVVRAWANP